MSNSEFTKIFGRILILYSKIDTPKEKSQNLAFEIFNITLEYPWYCFLFLQTKITVRSFHKASHSDFVQSEFYIEGFGDCPRNYVCS